MHRARPAKLEAQARPWTICVACPYGTRHKRVLVLAAALGCRVCYGSKQLRGKSHNPKQRGGVGGLTPVRSRGTIPWEQVTSSLRGSKQSWGNPAPQAAYNPPAPNRGLPPPQHRLGGRGLESWPAQDHSQDGVCRERCNGLLQHSAAIQWT